MIEHRPYGIDDPYKRLPTERTPRDPEPGEPVRVGFTTDAETTGAWVSIEGRRIDAQSLGGGLWTAALGPLAPGAHAYRLHATGPAGDQTAGPFPLEIGRWHQAARLLEAREQPQGIVLALGADDRSGPVNATLSFPTAGACRIELSTGEPTPVAGLSCITARQAGRLRLLAEGIEVELDTATLELRARVPGRDAWAFQGSVALRWLELPDGGVTRLETGFRAAPFEALYGLGERFDPPDKRGRQHDARVYEEYKEQGGRTYLPVPLVVSSRAYGVWLDAAEPSRWDLRGDTCSVRLEKLPAPDVRLVLHAIIAPAPYGITSAFTRLTGTIAVPPRWAFGPWMSSNDWNSQARTEAAVRRTVHEDVPATALVIEAWSDESTFYIFNDARYAPRPGREAPRLADFEFGSRWPDPRAMVKECHAHGIRVLLWQIPVLKHVPEEHAQSRADEAHALERGLVIQEADGSPYRCKGWWFTGGLVADFTNPETREWWFAKRAYLFDELGIDGLKTDGGEHLWGRDLRAHDGRRGLELYNAYPNDYVGAYHEFVQERTGGDGLTFSRAGYTGAQRYPAHWAGDENSTWNALRASIQAGLSAGLSGISIWGWDIGGFSGEIPTVELYLRSTAFACFCPIMQYHSEFNAAAENRDRSPWNIAERHDDPRALEVYRRYAKLRMMLLDYLHDEARAGSAAGLPLMRYPALEFPAAHDWLAADPHSFLLGRDLLVCPVVEKGALARDVLLPPGQWTDLWTGERFEGLQTLNAPAPLERIPVFVRSGSERLDLLLDAARTLPGLDTA